MPHMDAAIDDETFDLVKHRRVRRIAVAAVDAAGRDDPDRRLLAHHRPDLHRRSMRAQQHRAAFGIVHLRREIESVVHRARGMRLGRSEEHTSELQSLMRISYAVFCLKKKKELTIN